MQVNPGRVPHKDFENIPLVECELASTVRQGEARRTRRTRLGGGALGRPGGQDADGSTPVVLPPRDAVLIPVGEVRGANLNVAGPSGQDGQLVGVDLSCPDLVHVDPVPAADQRHARWQFKPEDDVRAGVQASVG